MAGTALSTLANYKDTDRTHEHTYFGNGNYGGATTVGATYQTTTYNDGETQKIGTYYNFQAATIGTGASLTTSGSQAPESFCPVGWQLPTGNNQNVNKAFQKLLNSYNITNNSGGSVAARKYPLSYLLSGYYRWSDGRLYSLGSYGYWWFNTLEEGGNAYRLYIREVGINADANGNMNYGFPLRCVSTYEYIVRANSYRCYYSGQYRVDVVLEQNY